MSRTVGESPEELPCARCKKLKIVADFPVSNSRGKSRYHSYCIECCNSYGRDFRAKDPDNTKRKANAYYRANAERKQELARQRRVRTPDYGRQASLKKLYGITLGEYEALLNTQNGVCAVCAEPPRGRRKFLAVDHDHETGLVRGLLCTTCNVGLGALRDSPELLRAALTYLRGGGD